jgi:tetratricopeptide (TPR) repeat protein
MDTLMSAGCGALRKVAIVASCLFLALQIGLAQKKSIPATATGTRAILVEKAHALESRGRPDMAIQIWQQILLSDPRNTEALAGLAKDFKLIGSIDKSSDALERLRKINPNDPNISKIEAQTSSRTESDQLRHAGELARQGKPDDAMRIYRGLYGDHPPDGDIALAYYQTLYGTANGKQTAIAAMRGLADRNPDRSPGDPRFAVELGTMLTYDGRTRAEGMRILKAHPNDANAQAALRQALIWDSANPASAAETRQYLKDHPQDTELSGHLKENEQKLAQMNTGIARTAAERAAFAALNAHRAGDAERLFTAILAHEPGNARIAAGMGFLRMQQSNFAAAISYLTQAEQNGYKAKAVEDALATSRFWYTMGEATQAFDNNQMDVASAKYQAALVMRPRSAEALSGLAGLLTKQQQYASAAGVYEQLVRVQPGSVEAWRGLFLAYARDNRNQRALDLSARIPGPVKVALARDPEYLRTLATIYHAENRNADAQRVLALALSLPFPDNGTHLKADTKLQYAGILMEAKRFDQAGELYSQILNDDPSNLSAWEGMISAHHQVGQDNQAIADVQKMPPATYEAALADPAFLSMLGAVYQRANQFEIAQGFLERAAKLQIAAGGQPSVSLQLQLAGIDLARNNTTQAYDLYQEILRLHPDRVDAWKGLIDALLATNRNAETLKQIVLIPAPIRKQLEADFEFVQSEASLYAALGDNARAAEYMRRVQAHYSQLKMQPPANIEVQNAWLLFNTGNDRLLYPALMRLGGRKDLTVAQRETVQNIWANWSVRRAGAAMDNGNVQRAVDILDAASQAFPDNLDVRKAVAGGYAMVGRARESLKLYKTIPMQDATAGDFQGAVGAALAANDKTQAEIWLRQALERYSRDPAILSLAARFEQARGDNQRAADFYRASLAAMPASSPTDRLAHALYYPEQDTRTHRAVTAADLQHLLDPNYEPFQKTTKLPRLPSYGPDPYSGPAPVPSTTQSVSPDTGSPNAHLSRQAAHARYFGNARLLRVSSSAAPSASFVGWPPQQAQLQDQSYSQQGQISANPPHSLASDAWKGLVFSLMASGRNTEALNEIAKIPPDVRRQLEADIEFVQGEASLYAAIGDIPHATEYLNRVETFYLLHRASAPAGLEVQHAWLLYDTQNDRGLYPLLLRLDLRTDLSAAQRTEVDSLWADFAVRRSFMAFDNGNLARGVMILQAASQEYPDNMNVRRAVAGAYAKVGKAQEAVALFKAIPMDNAASGDLQGAIGAALAAPDLAQAEIWLRQALGRFPADPKILGMAARFEQARGNNQRATDYWRAALAAMPPGSAAQKLDSGQAYPLGAYKAPAPGDLKRLLDPRNDPPQRTDKLPPLPSYHDSYSAAPSGASARPAAPQQNLNVPDNNPLPLPFPSPSSRRTVPNVPGRLSIQPARQSTNAPYQPSYTGTMHLPPSEQNIVSTDPVSSGTAQGNPGQSSVRRPQSSGAGNDAGPASRLASGPVSGLRITSQPMGTMAAQVQTRFADQTDGQLTQGSATQIHAIANASALQSGQLSPGPSRSATVGEAQYAQYNDTQYTPSAQDAAAGAYSASKQQAPPAQTQQPVGQPAPPKPAASKKKLYRKKTAASTAAKQPAPAPTLEMAEPAQQDQQQVQIPPPESQEPAEPAPSSQTTASPDGSGQGLTDEELQQRDLPPLRGPWVRIQRGARPIDPREEAEMQLRSIESGYSAWFGGAGIVNYRSGALGYDHLSALEAPFEASMPLGYNARLTIVAKPVFLDSGQADGSGTITVQEQTTAGTSLISIPQPIGTLIDTATTLPAQQNAVGIGGEVQLAFPHLALAAGYTPEGFLVATFTGRAQWKPGDGPFTFNFVRDPVKDTQLSYSGLRDPAGNTLGNQGQIWGGVMANQGTVQFAHGDAESGFYFGVGGQYLAGYRVETNIRIDGSGGAYWRLKTVPEFGNLSIGANFFGMHYAHNENAFTLGMGGYFSPQAYFLANVPISWAGHDQTRWHYNVVASLGVQGFQENLTKLFPLAAQSASEIALNNPMLPAKTSVGPNYDLRSQVAYQIGPHWFAGGFFAANNSRGYNSVSAGFSIHYMFRAQPSTAAGPTGLFPVDGVRPFRVP